MGDQRKNFGGRILAKRSIDKNEPKGLAGFGQFRERTAEIGSDDARAAGQAQLRQIVGDCRSRLARSIHKNRVIGAARQRFESE